MADLEFEADVDLAPGALREMTSNMERGLSEVVRRFGRELNDLLGTLSKGTKNVGPSPEAVSRTRRLRSETEGLGKATDEVRRSTRSMETDLRGYTALTSRVQAVSRQFEGLAKSARAFGLSSQQLAPLEQNLRDLARFQDQFNREISQGNELTQDQRRYYSTLFSTVERGLKEQGKFLASSLRQEEELRRRTAREGVVARQAAEQKQLAITRDAGRERLILAQAQANRELQIQKTADARSLASRRALFEALGRFQRLLGATLGRTADIAERAGSSIFRSLGRGFQGAFRTVIPSIRRGTDNIGDELERGYRRSFRRSAQEITEGGNRSERAMRQTFAQQESIVRSSTLRQERLYSRLEAQSSRGLVGAATGRSRLGSLVGGGLAFGGGFLVIDQLRKGFDESVNLNESLNKTRQIFGEATQAVVDFSEQSVESLFITRSAALEAAANFGIFGKSAGLTGPALSKFSTDLLQLATDLASFNNTTVDDAITAISAALRGEQEPIRRYGVLLDQATLQQTAFENGITKTIRTLTPQERVLAAQIEIFKQTADQQGDAARTANDFANSSRRAGAALTTFFASIIGKVTPFATAITNVAFPALQGLTAFVEGDVSPAMNVLRDAVIGASAALGGLLIAKAAGEAIQFLGIALRGLTTPLGLLILSVGAIGAGINILAQRSPGLRDALSNLGEAAGQLLEPLARLAANVVELLAPAVEFVARFLDNTLIPALTRGINAIANNLQPALQGVVNFFRNTVIPAVGAAVSAVAGFVERNLPTALDFLAGAAERVGNFLQPIVDAATPVVAEIVGIVTTIGTEIGRLFTGDFSFFQGDGAGSVGGRSGFSLLVERITAPFISLGSKLIGYVKDAFSSLGNWIQNNSGSIIEAVRGVFETIGFVIASVLTDPKLIGGLLAAIAVLARNIVLPFLQGFGRGVLDNVEEFAGYVQEFGPSVLAAMLRGIQSNLPQFLAALAAAMFGFRFIRFARTQMQAAGQQGGLAFVQGVSSATRGFARGLFGNNSRAFVSGTARTFNEATAAAKRELGRLNRDLALFGRTTFTPSGPGRGPLDEALASARASREELGRVVSDAQVQGARFQEGIRSGFIRPITNFARSSSIQLRNFQTDLASGGWRTAFRNAGSAVQSGAASLGARLKAGIAQAVAQARVSARSAGVGLGAALASGVAGGIAGGQIAGGADDGLSQALGITTILATSLAVGSINPVAGAATAAVGLLSTAFAANQKAAQKAKNEIREYADALREIDPSDVGAIAEAIQNTLTENLRDESEGVRELFAQVAEATGIGIDDIAEAAAQGGPALDAAIERFLGAADRIAGGSDLASQALRESLRDFFGDELGNELDAAIRSIEQERRSITPDIVIDTGSYAVNQALRDFDIDALQDRAPTLEVPVEIEDNATVGERLLSGLGEIADQLRTKFDQAWESFNRLINPDQSTLNASIVSAGSSLAGVAQTIGQADPASTLGQAAIAAAQQDARTSISEVIQSGVRDGFAAGLTETEVLKKLEPQLRGLISEGLQLPADFEGDSQLVEQFRQSLLTQIPGILQQAISTANVALTQEQQAALLESFQGFLRDSDLNLGDIGLGDIAPEDLASALAAIESVDPTIVSDFELADDPSARAQQIADLVAAYEAGANGEDLTLSPDVDTAGLQRALLTLGQQAGQGLVDGINSKAGAVRAAASNLAGIITNTISGDLKVRSPSRVMREIGQFAGQGLAIGLTESLADFESRISDAVGRVLDTVNNTVKGRRGTLGQTIADLFRGLQIGGGGPGNNPIARVTGRSDVGQAITTGLTQAADDLYGELIAILQTPASERTATQKARLKQIGTVRNEGDLFDLGRTAQRDAITGALAEAIQQIQGFAEAQLEGGVSVNKVIAQMEKFREELIKNAAAIFGQKSAIIDIIDSLGLSKGAIDEFADAVKDLEDDVKRGANSATGGLLTADQILAAIAAGASVSQEGIVFNPGAPNPNTQAPYMPITINEALDARATADAVANRIMPTGVLLRT